MALCCAAAGCQSEGRPSTVAAESRAAEATHPATVDVCPMLAAADISPLLNMTVAGRPDSNMIEAGDCVWTNPTTQESVTVDIGGPDTAPGNTLPPPTVGIGDMTPGPDGMRLLSGGMVIFAAGNRKNSVQVAVLRISEDQRHSAAVTLARRIIPQVPR